MIRLVPLLCLPLALHAQDGVQLTAEGDTRMVMVRGVSGSDGAASPLFQATWRFAGSEADPVMSFQRTSMEGDASGVMLDELVLAGMGAFLDEHVHFEKQGVRADLPVPAMVGRLNGMVRAATDELGGGDGTAAVSQPTMEQLDRLCRIDWSQARFGVDGGAEQDKYLAIYYYVRSQREELARQLKADLLPLSRVPVVRAEVLPPGRSVPVNSVCGTVFDDQNYLCALDLALEDTMAGAPDTRLDPAAFDRLVETKAPPALKVRKRDRWLKAELDRLNERIEQADQRRELWALRDRLDDIEARMDDLSMEVQDLQAETPENPLADLSALTGSNITLHFAKGSVVITAEHQVLLNEVFEQLARGPRQRLLITGYSDTSGDPATNLRLSEMRARVVRDHLLRRGIAEDRLLMNYLGAARATGDAARDRRVELEWIAE